MWPAWLFAPFLLTHDADEREAYEKGEGKHTFADFCLFFVRHEVDKYLIDPYINSRDVYPIFPFCEELSIFFSQTPFVQTYALFAPMLEGLIFHFAFTANSNGLDCSGSFAFFPRFLSRLGEEEDAWNRSLW